MDRRIAERRVEVQRGRRRRRRRRWVSGAALVALVAVGGAAATSPLFEIAEVRVTGVDAEQAEQVRAAAGIEVGSNLLAADVDAASAAVDALSWVRESEIVRMPPATVELRVRQREPLAAVRTGGEVWTVDEHGAVLRGGGGEDLVAIDAPESALPRPGGVLSDAAVLNALAFHAGLPDGFEPRVRSYEADGPTTLRMAVDAGGEETVWVRVGVAEQVELKAEVVEALLGQAQPLLGPEGSGVDEFDVRAPENPVVVPAEGT